MSLPDLLIRRAAELLISDTHIPFLEGLFGFTKTVLPPLPLDVERLGI